MRNLRREFLVGIGASTLSALAGCSTSNENEEETEAAFSTGTTKFDSSETSTKTPSNTLTPTTTSRTDTDEGSPSTNQAEKIAANDGDADDRFGASTAITPDGTTLLIGAEFDEDPNGTDAGSAYVFEKADGTWAQQAKLVANDGDRVDEFGDSVALSDDGTIAIIGASRADTADTKAGQLTGAAYVFEKSEDSWSQHTKLVADDGDRKDAFGGDVAISGDGTTIFIGAWGDEDPHGKLSGSAYVFTKSGSSWNQEEKLTLPEAPKKARFGNVIELSTDGTTAIIGAFGARTMSRPDAGVVSVFKKKEGSWTWVTDMLTYKGETEGDNLGSAVGISKSANIVVVGAPDDENPNGKEAGSAYVFEMSGEDWEMVAKLTPDDGDKGDFFGYPIEVSDDGKTALIGAYQDEDPNGEDAGSAYVFTNSGGTWSQQTKLLPGDDGEGADYFGYSVSLSGDGNSAVVGAPADTDSNGKGGAVYVYD